MEYTLLHYRMQSMKRVIFIIVTILWAVLILYLSFQRGPETAHTSMNLTQFVVGWFYDGEPPYDALMLWDGRFRLAAHFVLFFLYGIWAVIGMEEWSHKLGLSVTTALTSGAALAVFSEVGKLGIAGRHCDFGEMQLNIFGVLAGGLLTMCCILGVKRLKH